MDKTTYSAAGLATALGVPRTTINDWLTRYENYIDSETIGKRKVYAVGNFELCIAKVIAHDFRFMIMRKIGACMSVSANQEN